MRLFNLIRFLVRVGGETCFQFETRIGDLVMASKISTIAKYQFKNGEHFNNLTFDSFPILEPHKQDTN